MAAAPRTEKSDDAEKAIRDWRFDQHPPTKRVCIGSGPMAPRMASTSAAAGQTTRIPKRNSAHARAAARWAAVRDPRIEGLYFADADLVTESVTDDCGVLGESCCERLTPGPDAEALVTTNTSNARVGCLATSLTHASCCAALQLRHPVAPSGGGGALAVSTFSEGEPLASALRCP
jgi:hypothetical protein